MKHLKLEDNISYNGSQIEPSWAFKTFGIKDSSIVSWIGPMEIEPENLIDFEDVGLEIKGEMMMHFIIEHFDVQPADIKLCYHRQRIFVMIVKDFLEEIGVKTTRYGDDLFFKKQSHEGEVLGKLSVSIATCSTSSMKIHFAINLTENGTPDDVETAGVLGICADLAKENMHDIADEICKTYMDEISSIEKDICKTKVF